MTDSLHATTAPSIPHNLEAEEAVIGAILVWPDVYHECALEIPDGAVEFYIHRNGMVWTAFENLVRANTPIDVLTAATELESLGYLSEIGGPAHLTALVSRTPNSLNASAYAKIVHKQYVRRQMIKAANKVAEFAYDQSLPVEDAASGATHALSASVSLASISHVISMHDSVGITSQIVETNGELDELPGIPTPLVDLNKLMGGGAQSSDLSLIVARPGRGKTSLLEQIARHASRYTVNQTVRKNHVVIFSAEMPHEQLTMRMLSQMTGIDFQRIRSGKIPENKYPEFLHALEELSSLDITIDDKTSPTPAYIRSRCELLSGSKPVDMICVDSLNLMRSGVDFGKRRDMETDYCATELKNIGRDFRIPVWAAHQMNRDVERRSENAKPVLADLREGGEQPADNVFFIHHEYANKDMTLITASYIIAAKQRNGPVDEIPVAFVRQYTRFENAVSVKMT